MKTIEAVIERSLDGMYSVYCRREIFSGAGETIEQAKKDMLAQMDFYRETAKEEGFKYPAWLDDEYVIIYDIDAISLMNYYVSLGYFSLSGIEKMTGISQKQLWTYLNGTKPRKAQSDRIVSGIRKVCNDLNGIFA
ncbi:MAG: type II toxin-antitoxin system HicB family antitoxin [Bacteroidales bacterium]|nr:type II toxin-antitoxin system HicB family antitoxin [Bacteroidales bacterium]